MTRPLIAALVLLSGCSVPTLTPDATQVPSARFSSAVPQAQAGLEIDWWSRIGDAQLTELLLMAQTGSPDLRTAAAQVMAARSRAGQDAAAQWPNQRDRHRYLFGRTAIARDRHHAGP